MDYIEVSLAKRLDQIQDRMERNAQNFDEVVQSYYAVEKRAVELKASQTSSRGSNLLTDDVKFFFNLVKKGTLTPIKNSKSKQRASPSRGLLSSHDKENQPRYVNYSRN